MNYCSNCGQQLAYRTPPGDDRARYLCESCGEEIGIKRLEARPTATQCIDCKTLDEIREKQMA